MKLLSIVLTYYPHVIPVPVVNSGSLSVHRNYPTSPLVHKSLMKLLEQTTSNHFKVSSEAINLVTSEMMLCKYMLVDYPTDPSKYYLKALIARLVSNKKHWNIIVRELSDTKYDMLLDYYWCHCMQHMASLYCSVILYVYMTWRESHKTKIKIHIYLVRMRIRINDENSYLCIHTSNYMYVLLIIHMYTFFSIYNFKKKRLCDI